MAGIKSLRKLQLGLESTKGTAVPATTVWRGTGVLDDQREVVFPEEDIGFIPGVDRSYIPRLAAALSMEETPATFEQLPYILSAGVKDQVAGVQDGAGSADLYTYTFPTTAKNSIKTYTIEGGDDQEAEEIEYAFVEGFELNGVAGEALMMSAEWIGRQVTQEAFTGSLSLPTVEEMLFSKGKLFIDADSGSFGGTQVSNSMLEARLSVDTGWAPVFTADGSLFFSFEKITMPELVLEILFEHDGSSTTEKANWRNEVARLIRLDITGEAVATPGTTYSNKRLLVDLAGKWERFEPLDERDGNDIVQGTFRARYNSTAAAFAEIVVVNELVSLP